MSRSSPLDALNYANGSDTITGNEAGTPFFESRHGQPTTVSLLRHGDNCGSTFDVSHFWWDQNPTLSGSTPWGIPTVPPPSGPWVESNLIVTNVLTGGEGLPGVAQDRLERPLVHSLDAPDPAALVPQETVDGRLRLIDGTTGEAWQSRPDPIGYRRPAGSDPGGSGGGDSGGGDSGGSGGGDSGGGDSGGSGGFDLLAGDLDSDDGWPTAEQLGAVRWEARPRHLPGPPVDPDGDGPDEFLSRSLDSGGGDKSMAVRTGGGSFTGLPAEQQADVLAILLGAQPNGESTPKSSSASGNDHRIAAEVHNNQAALSPSLLANVVVMTSGLLYRWDEEMSFRAGAALAGLPDPEPPDFRAARLKAGGQAAVVGLGAVAGAAAVGYFGAGAVFSFFAQEVAEAAVEEATGIPIIVGPDDLVEKGIRRGDKDLAEQGVKGAAEAAERGAKAVAPNRGSTEPFNIDLNGKGLLSEIDADGIVDFSVDATGPGMRGTDMFKQMMEHYGDNVKGIRGMWSSKIKLPDNLNLGRVNELTAQGMPLEEAIHQAWTARRAAELGYKNARIVNQTGSPGNYKNIEVVFTK